MSRYTIGEVAAWMLLAALLGFALGWLVRDLVQRTRSRAATPVAVVEPTDPPPEPRIKGKERSKIYHVPGSPLYDRTHADRWFATEDEAVAAGFRPPKNA